MTRMVGTVVRGLRGPIIREGDDLAKIVSSVVLEAAQSDGFAIRDRDVLGITESVVARAQGNYISVDAIAEQIRRQFPGDTLGLVFPILSRNRFSILLRAIARAKKKVVIQFSFPTDEVGNHLISDEKMEAYLTEGEGKTQFDEAAFRSTFGSLKHPFTGMDYVQFYRDLCAEENCSCQAVFSNNPIDILHYTRSVLACDIHTRFRTCARLHRAGAEKVLGLHELCTEPMESCGYNPEYGLLGSNKSTEEKVKLFPRPCQDLVLQIQKNIQEQTGHTIEVMVYGDGAFKDPVGQIWELADPVVSPAYTPGLEGTPHELKLKYLADNDFANLSADEQKQAIVQRIQEKQIAETDGMAGQGTTPRRLTDLLGSLFDLTSGSGDKGTPFVYVQGYFDTYAEE